MKTEMTPVSMPGELLALLKSSFVLFFFFHYNHYILTVGKRAEETKNDKNKKLLFQKYCPVIEETEGAS